MLASVLIAKKRDGFELTQAEIDFLIEGYVAESIPDYQMSAWAMAVYLKGMTPAEIEYLTDAMIASGGVLPKSGGLPRVDKHSTGGLGDKTSLVLAPLLAMFDLHVPMISGRGLGITGGTLDKLEAIPGFRTDLDESEIASALQRVGCVITGATKNLVPADRKLYGLRDVTATVPSIPLITASIMSKKLAESLDSLVLDVKWGSGAFMQSRSSAMELARSLLRIGRRMGVKTSALLTDMNQPLGKMVGNANEVNESIEVLKGDGPEDVLQVTIELAVELLVSTERFADRDLARTAVNDRLKNGSVWERFQAMVACQGGEIAGPLPLATSFAFTASSEGWVQSIDGQLLGQCVIMLGGGRRVAGEKLDHQVGLEMLCRIGDQVDRSQPLLTVYARKESDYQAIRVLLEKAIVIGSERSTVPALIESIEE